MNATLILLNHVTGGHTGSHAVCSAIARMDVVEDNTDCMELEDTSGLEIILSNLKKATKPFMVTITAIFDGAQGERYIRKLKASDAYRSGRVRLLSLERSDLMRWSLSQYDKFGVQLGAPAPAHGVSDAQFHPGATLSRRRYELPILSGVAAHFACYWVMHAEATSAFPPSVATFIFYEDLLSAGSTPKENEAIFAHWVMHWVMHGVFPADRAALEKIAADNVSPTYEYASEQSGKKSTFSKFHPNDIDGWVENADEVRHHFRESHLAAMLRSAPNQGR